MTYQELVAHFGGTQTKTAAALGCDQSLVSRWKREGMPLRWQLIAEAVSGAVLLADRSLLPNALRDDAPPTPPTDGACA